MKEKILALPQGIGYKCAWMVVQGKSQVAIKQAVFQNGTKKRA